MLYFFGSSSKGEDTERSDFDICIIGSKEIEINLKNRKRIKQKNFFTLHRRSERTQVEE